MVALERLVPKRSAFRTGTFVLVSVGLHAAVLASWHRSPPLSLGAAPLSVQLLAAAGEEYRDNTAPSAPADKPPATPKQSTQRPSEQKRIAMAAPQPVSQRQPKEAPVSTPNSAIASAEPASEESTSEAPETSATQTAQIEQNAVAQSQPKSEDPDAGSARMSVARIEQLRHQLNQQLAHYFSYPLMARKRGWQGEVVLAFSIRRDGTIGDIRIARSSGHALLDKSAARSLAQVHRIAAINTDVEMDLPVVYRLQDI